MIGFTDDLAVVVIAKQFVNMELYGSKTIHGIEVWLRMVKLYLASEKTKAVIITNRKKTKSIQIRVGNRGRYKIDH